MHKITRQYTPQVATPYRTEELEQKSIEIDKIGFSDKTMWDWLILFSTLAIPLVVLCATIVFSIQQEKASDAQHTNELRIAEANRQNDLMMANTQEEETTVSTYLDGLTMLLLDKKLGSPEEAYDASVVARAKTMIVLQRLNDPQRKSMVIQFLYDAHLITGKQPRVSLNGVDLSNVDLRGANLSGANLNMALLRNTDLRDAILSGADMQGAIMKGADLRGADMKDTRLTNDQLQQMKR